MSQVITDANNPFFDHSKPKQPLSQRILKFAEIAVGLVFAGILLYLFIFVPHEVKGKSMEQTFFNGEILIVNRLFSLIGDSNLAPILGLEYQQGDVVVFHKPQIEDSIVKRIIGMPGDTVAMEDGRIYVNGKLANETYLPQGFITPGGDFLGEGDQRVVPPGKYFVMGDNRPNSMDSRTTAIGFVEESWIVGKVVMRVLPIQTFTFVGTGKIDF